jgi:hypothetical protein
MFNLSRKPSEDGLPTARILPFRNRKSVVALDIEGDTLRFAQASGSGSSARVTRLGSAKIEITPDKREDPAVGGGGP